jgi:hypothetical protein
MSKFLKTQLLAFICAIVLVAAGASAFAQEHPFGQPHHGGPMGPQGSSIMGTVTLVNGTTIELFNGLFSIDASQAKIISPGPGMQQGSLTLANILPGTHITAVVTVANATTLQATTIIVPRMENNTVALKGALQSVDVAGNSLTLLNHKIVVNSNTKFSRNLKGLADLKANENIFVVAEANGSELVALAIGSGPSAAMHHMNAGSEHPDAGASSQPSDDEK